MTASLSEQSVMGHDRSLTAPLTLPTITVELGLYATMALAALIVRLAALGTWPLLDAELYTALAALRTLEGSAWRPGIYSPLLYDANLALFALTQATDAAVRLLPALVGAGLVFLPYLVRDVLGRQGALMAAGLLAFAPTWVLASRTGDGALVGVACGAALLVAGYRYLRDGSPGLLQAAIIALALGLTASASFHTALLAAAGLLAYWWARHGDAPAEEWGTRVRAALSWRSLALLVGAFVLVATGFLVNPGGIGASVALVGHWAQRLLPRSAPVTWLTLPRNLVLYEALTLALALVGLVAGLGRRRRLAAWLGIWAGGSLLLGTLLGHREAFWLLDPLLPLVALAGLGAQWLWDYLAGEASLLDAVMFALLLVPLGFVYLQGAAYLHTAQAAYLDRALVGLVALLAAWAGYALWSDRRSALRVGAALASVVLLVAMARATTALAYQTARDPHESLLYRPTSTQLRDFEERLRDLSYRHTGDARALRVAYDETLDLWMGWYLRNVRARPGVSSVETVPVLVTWARSEEDRPVGYAGERFRLLEARSDAPLSLRETLRWVLYRYPPRETQPMEIQVWTTIPQDAILAASGSAEGTDS